jgi:hypothetical protein
MGAGAGFVPRTLHYRGLETGSGNVGVDRLQNPGHLPRAMRAQRAAAYLDLSVSIFLRFLDERAVGGASHVAGGVAEAASGTNVGVR